MVKFGRNYQLDIETKEGGILTITPPFTVEFDIIRNILSSANTSSLRIFNLSDKNRSLIRKDRIDFTDLRNIQFKAGYGQNLSVCFEGFMTQAWSVREGTNNMVTEILSFDGGDSFINSTSDLQFPSGTPQDTIVKALLANLPNVSIGSVGNYPGTTARGTSYSGNTNDILRQITNGGFFIDNGQANCLGDSECLAGDIDIISPENGLLGTPILEETYVNIEMLFEPRLRIGQEIRLQSITGATFNGSYRVISIAHRGIISEAVSGTATTAVGLIANSSLIEVPK